MSKLRISPPTIRFCWDTPIITVAARPLQARPYPCSLSDNRGALGPRNLPWTGSSLTHRPPLRPARLSGAGPSASNPRPAFHSPYGSQKENQQEAHKETYGHEGEADQA